MGSFGIVIGEPPARPTRLPVVIDTTDWFAFIELDALFFVFHRLEEPHRLLLTHLAFLDLFGFGDLPFGLLFRLVLLRTFHFARWLFAW